MAKKKHNPTGKHDPVVDSERENILVLHGSGLKYYEIAAQTGRSSPTVRRVCLGSDVPEGYEDKYFTWGKFKEAEPIFF